MAMPKIGGERGFTHPFLAEQIRIVREMDATGSREVASA
jgi:hypothetical protein